MTENRTAYMPLATFPEALPDSSVQAAVSFAVGLGLKLQVTTFAVDIPQMQSPLGDLLLDIPDLVRSTEKKSRAECLRLQSVAQAAARGAIKPNGSTRVIIISAMLDEAANEARYFDFAVLPWSSDSVAGQDMAQSVIFGSGRPVVLVPPHLRSATSPDHLAVAWDGSRVAARAMWDALPLLRKGGRVSVLTVRDEKPLRSADLGRTMASHLEQRGIHAQPFEIALCDRGIADALQETALEKGAQILVMGGFGHSRLRDFLLGGATRGVLTKLQIPTLFSH